LKKLSILAMAYNNRDLSYVGQDKKAEAVADLEKFITLTSNPQLAGIARRLIEKLSR